MLTLALQILCLVGVWAGGVAFGFSRGFIRGCRDGRRDAVDFVREHIVPPVTMPRTIVAALETGPKSFLELATETTPHEAAAAVALLYLERMGKVEAHHTAEGLRFGLPPRSARMRLVQKDSGE